MYRHITTIMNISRRSQRIALVSVLLVFASGCSSIGIKGPWNHEPAPDYKLIAANLVNSLSQFPHLNPLMATVQMTEPTSGFTRSVKAELLAQGYKVDTILHGEGVNQVNPQIKEMNDDDAEQNLYILNIGRVSAERAYATIAGQTVPVSEQVIRGVDERKVTLNDDIFDKPDAGFTQVAFKPYNGPTIEDVLAPEASQSAADSIPANQSGTAVKANLYETLVSNYADMFEGFGDVNQSILIFPNDSLRLGDANKLIIEQYVESMNPKTDILSVIGCSHGKTAISNGNSLLALGRANRVKEALLFSGVEHDRILDEGCWSPHTFDEVMPRRGVVLTLKRQKNS